MKIGNRRREDLFRFLADNYAFFTIINLVILTGIYLVITVYADHVAPCLLYTSASEAPWKFTDPLGLWKLTEPQPRMGWARVTDGPYLYRAKNGELLMVWSSFSNTAYTCGYARSLSGEITGPWKQEPEPLFSQDGGHSMLFTDFKGRLLMCLHSPNRSGQERMLLFEMEEEDVYKRQEVYISFLRKKLEFLKADICIVTSRKLGYRLVTK